MLDQLDDEALERLVKKKQKEKELALQQLAEKEEKMLETEVDTPIIPPTPPKTPIQKFDNNEPPANEPEEEMTFLGHLEVLRWHLFRSAIAVVIFTVIAFITMIDYIFQPIIMGPSRVDFWTYRKLCELGEVLSIDALCIQKLGFTIQSRELGTQFMTHITASFVIGFVVAFPYLFWEVWRFIKPALYKKEQNTARGTVFFVSILFFMGVLFGYYGILPMSLNFLGNYQLDPKILNEFDLSNYLSNIVSIVLAAGLMFQLPVFSYFFSSIGVLNPQVMINYRRHAVVVIFFVAAILTPPDVASQLLMGLPLYLLYEVSIYISKFVIRRQNRKTI